MQLCAAASQHHTIAEDIACQFGRGLFQHLMGGGADLLTQHHHRLVEVAGGNIHLDGQAGQQAAALHLHRLVKISLLGAAGDVLFQLLCGTLADGNAELVADMLQDLVIIVVARHTDTGGLDLTAQRQDSDIGGAAADIAVLSLGGKVKATSVRVAGNHYDDEILKHVRNKFSIAIGQRTAEQLKKNVACCPQKADFNETMEIKGRSLLTGLPIRVNVSTSDLYEPVMMLSEQIGTAAHQVLEKTPPELAGDIFRNGVVLTGGGAQLHGLPEYLSQELKVNVEVSPDPVNCVALGTAMSLGVRDKLETGFTDATPRIGRR